MTGLPLAKATLRLLHTALLAALLHAALLLADAQVLPVLANVHAERAQRGQVEIARRAETGLLLEAFQRSRRLVAPAPVDLARVEAQLSETALDLQHLVGAGVERRTLTLQLTALAELLHATLLLLPHAALAKLLLPDAWLAELLRVALLLTGLLPELLTLLAPLVLLGPPLAGLLLAPLALLLSSCRVRRDQRQCSASKDGREQSMSHEIFSRRDKRLGAAGPNETAAIPG